MISIGAPRIQTLVVNPSELVHFGPPTVHATPLRVGDRVKLNSGGPEMTVMWDEDPDMVFCTWRFGPVVDGAWLSPCTLTRVA